MVWRNPEYYAKFLIIHIEDYEKEHHEYPEENFMKWYQNFFHFYYWPSDDKMMYSIGIDGYYDSKIYDNYNKKWYGK
jgi:hypothetical protein